MEDKSRDELRAAQGRAAAHRLLLRETLFAARKRVSPGELKRDVSYSLRKVGRDTKSVAKQTVKEHPYALGGAIAAIAAYALRKPIAKLSPQLGAWIGDRYEGLRDRFARDPHDADRNAILTGGLVKRDGRSPVDDDIEGE